MSEEQVDADEVKRTLRRLGWNQEAGEKPQEEAPAAEADAFAALDIKTHDEVETIPIPEDVSGQLEPKEKERVRHLAGGVEDTAEEEPAAKKKLDPWSRDVPELGKVSVSAEELEEYTRALLFDECFKIPVGLWMGRETFTVEVRSLYVSEKELMACALSRLAESYPIKTINNAAVISDYLLKMSVIMQITKVNNESKEYFDARPEPGQLPEKSPKIDELVKRARTEFGNVHQAKLKAMIRAVHMFETKQQILEDAFHNRDFPLPAGAS